MQFITSIAFLVVAAAGVLAQVQIDTPSAAVECQPTKLTFSGGQPPYIISIIPGGQTGAAAIETLPQASGTSTTWIADIARGTSITLEIKDQTGQTGLSGIVTIQPGTDATCVGKNSASSGSGSATAPPASSVSGSASSRASTTAPASISSAPGTSAVPSVTSASAAKPATSSGSAAAAGSGSAAASASAATKSSAALRLNSGSASGIIGMLLAALLV